MNIAELQRALRQLRLGGMASVLETRLHQAQAEPMAPIDLISCLISDELSRRADRLLERRRKQAGFRDPNRTLDSFDFTFNPKMNRSLVFDLATGGFIAKREDALFLGPGGTGKSHLAQAIGQSAILQGYRVFYREVHVLLDELADAVAEGTRKQYLASLAAFQLLIIDDFGMRKLPLTAAEDLLEIIMRRYERTSTLLTSNRPVEDWGKLLGDTAAVSSMLDRLLHHGHVLKCGPAELADQSDSREHHMSRQFACGSKEVKFPPFPFPPPGESRGGRVPPTPCHAPLPANNAGTTRATAPPTRGLRPLVHPRWAKTFSTVCPSRHGNSISLLPKLSRQGKTMTCPDCVPHWPVLR